LLKFGSFAAIRILREIGFRRVGKVQKCYFWQF